MSEPVAERRTHETDEDQVRRAERGIIAGYIHELSQRHGEEHAEPDGRTRPD